MDLKGSCGGLGGVWEEQGNPGELRQEAQTAALCLSA